MKTKRGQVIHHLIPYLLPRVIASLHILIIFNPHCYIFPKWCYVSYRGNSNTN
jgi:hypothetical protein